MAWVVTPPTQTQASRTGWVTSPTTTPTTPQRGWLGSGSITIMWGPRGNGALDATTMPRPFTPTPLDGDGALSATVLKREYRVAALSGPGALSASYSQIHPAAPQFNSTGFLFGDTVSTHLEPEFSGGGALSATSDGLRATVVPGLSIDVFFSGEGNLPSPLEVIYYLLAEFSGQGTLTGPLVPKLVASLAGSGALLASAYARYSRAAALLASGTLSATDFARYLRSVGLAGAGALTNLLQILFTPAAGGAGTVSATTKQIYHINMTPVTDDFNRANAPTLGANWTNRNGANGIINNAAYPTVVGYWCSTTHNTPMPSDDMEVSMTMGPFSTDGRIGATMGVGANGECASIFTDGANLVIATTTGWSYGGVAYRAVVPRSQNTAGGDTLTLRRVGNLYTGLMNGVPVPGLVWTDSGNAHPRDADHRQVGMNTVTNDGVVYRTMDSFSAVPAPSLSGGGTLSAEAFGGMLPKLTGLGALSSTSFANYLRSVGLSGVGVLTATDFAVYLRSVGLTGNGAITAPVSQVYPVNTGVGDSFDRPDSAVSAGPGWVNRNGVMGVSNGGMYPVGTNFWQEASSTAVMSGDDMEVSIVLGPFSGGGDYTTILLGCNEVGQGVFVFFNGGAGVTIYTQDDWALTNLAVQTSVGATQATGDRWTARRVGNTYTILKNDVPLLVWPDSTNIIPRDAAHRLVGTAQYSDGTGYRAIDSFTANTGALIGGGTLSATTVKKVAVTANFSGGGTVNATADFPVVAETTTQYTTVGAYTYTIPWWANYVDEIFLGAGGGGAGGSGATSATGNGALAGTYSNRILERGSNLPWATTQLTGNVGDGGNPGSQNNAGVGGNPVTRNAISGGDIARQGNGGGGGAGTGGDPGRGAGNLAFNGKTYVGGAQVSSGGNPGAAGLPPGGGGGGGAGGIFNTGKAGGKGGRGQAWFRAYQ